MRKTKQIIANNKKASFNYFLEHKIEAGVVLLGSEVKSLRLGKANIEDAYASYSNNELFLYNSHISPYDKSSHQNHDPRRPRKLLLHKLEIKKLLGKIKQKGYTIVPTSIYFDEGNFVKIEIALASGKKLHDKRETIKQRDWEREKKTLLKMKK
jgi:SsrA-binding protein